MVGKQAVESEAKTNTPRPKNQNWMDEFSSDMGSDDTESQILDNEENFAELFAASQAQQEIREGEVVGGFKRSVLEAQSEAIHSGGSDEDLWRFLCVKKTPGKK